MNDKILNYSILAELLFLQVVEKRVQECLGRADPHRRLVHQHFLDQIIGQWIHFLRILGQTDFSPFRKTDFKVWQFVYSRPYLICRRSHNSENLEQLIDLAITHEKWPFHYYFKEYAAQWPDIHRGRVMPCSHQDLRGSIPQSNHFMGVGLHWQSEGPCKSEISYLNSSIAVNEYVLGF